ncbi:MAG: NACHT domain-containing protein [Trichodesmium sp. MAG_R01]|nr:NACHT domain-containing protein [Trichodesmium sp. MAG_R01]
MASSLKASKTGLKVIDQARRSKGWNKVEEAWFEKARVSRSSLMRFWRGAPIVRESFIAICETVGCNWEEIWEEIVDKTISSTDPPDIEVDISEWQELCQTMLEIRRSLTTNQFTARDGIRFEVNDDIVPVGLVKRSRQRLFDKDFRPKPENGSELYKPEEEKIEYDDFLKLFKDVNSEKPRRIAIIGYPGDGKTTWLQKIAFWVLDNTNNLLIWISLGDLKDKTIEDYLLEDWLKAAYKKRIVEEKIENNFVEQFNKGRVWLLLDGVDEIAEQPVDTLVTVARQLTGWIGEARVVLTCRINVWDDSKNALEDEDFKTYQLLGFESDQINKLIDRWFKNTKIEEVGEQLREKLTPSPENQDKLNPNWKRLKDAIKNPLRLTILFYICRRNESLPKLDAEFYRQFIEIFYQWKKKRFSEKQDKRQKLENALKRLALEGVKQNQFILPHSLVENTTNDKFLFQLSLQLGLLNQVGIIKGSLNEKIYSFWHPAFQEYFAALDIIDYHKDYSFDFDIILQNFASQWSEVYIFWQNLKNISIDKVDECIYQFISLLTRKLENDNCQPIVEGLENILYTFDEQQLQVLALKLKVKIERQAVKTNSKNQNIIINFLNKIYKYTDDLNTRLLLIISLEKLNHKEAINTLISLWYENNELQPFIEKSLTKLKNSSQDPIVHKLIKDFFINDNFIEKFGIETEEKIKFLIDNCNYNQNIENIVKKLYKFITRPSQTKL